MQLKLDTTDSRYYVACYKLNNPKEYVKLTFFTGSGLIVSLEQQFLWTTVLYSKSGCDAVQ